MKRKGRELSHRLVAALALLLVAVVARGMAQDVMLQYNKLAVKPSPQLMQLGRDCFARHQADSALVCFTIVANRYSERMSQADKELVARALNDLGCVYYYLYFDYQQAHTNLMRALDMCDDYHLDQARPIVALNLANLLNGNHQSPGKVSPQAVKLYEQSLDGASRVGNWALYVAGFIDFVEYNPDADLKRYARIVAPSMPDTIDNLRYARNLYHALECRQRGQMAQARQWLQRQMVEVDARWTPERYVVQAHVAIADTYILEHDYIRAANELLEAERLAHDKGAIDYEVMICQKLSGLYRSMGHTSQAQAYKMRYLEMKDSVQQANSEMTVAEMNLVHSLQREEIKVKQLTEHQQRQRQWLVIAVVGLMLVLAFTLVLLRAYRLLKHSNQSLYDKNREVMQAESQERGLRKDYERKLQERDRTIEQMRIEQQESRIEQQEATNEKKADRPKYSHSSLNDEDKQRLIAQIQDVMADAEVICQQDFGVAKLAKLIGSNTSYVSQVINEKYGVAFSNLLGTCRIREACRRLDDLEHYGNMTIEAISDSVGFKSRVTFINTFKREIGLTPSQYLKMAKNQ